MLSRPTTTAYIQLFVFPAEYWQNYAAESDLRSIAANVRARLYAVT